MGASSPDEIRQLLVTIKDAGHMLGVGRNTIYELLAAHELTSVYFGRAHRIISKSIEDLISRRAATDRR
jgi:excisionase family DNA binding protein